jgi:hypothetical protein
MVQEDAVDSQPQHQKGIHQVSNIVCDHPTGNSLIGTGIPTEEQAHDVITEDIQNQLKSYRPKIRFQRYITGFVNGHHICTGKDNPTNHYCKE